MHRMVLSAKRLLIARLRIAACVLVCLGLVACGGGADTVENSPPTSNPPPPPPPPPPPTTPPPAGSSGLDARPQNTSCLATPQPTFGLSVSATRVFPNLTFSSPVLLLQAPGDDTAWFVVEKDGLVKRFANTNSTSTVTPFIDMRSAVKTAGEGGLLGMAFDPGYATNARAYLSYTAQPTVSGSSSESRISRFAAAGGVLNPASESILLRITQPNFDNHKGGNIVFGPDNLLYAGFGDGGSGGDPGNRAQNRSTLLGKLIRIDVSGAGAYVVPASNPFTGAGTARCQSGSAATGTICSEIYAYGLRNPWRWSFDRASPTPDLWLGDVGQSSFEEVDRIVSGGNYGWRVREGAHCYNATTCATTADGAPLIDPVAEYPRAVGTSITGGYVYRGTAIPALVGRYVFGDFGSGNIFALLPDAGGVLKVEQILASGAQISSFAQGSDGELYFVNFTGTLHKLMPGPAAPSNPIKPLLSQTGCVDAANPTQPASALIPYEPVAPFWSDGAAKTRWMALPDNTRITVEADGDWTFPTGTVLMKNFTLNGELIETRLFMRHTDTGNWGGYTYRWNPAHTDATLVSGGLEATIGTQTWSYPSEAQCLQCHTSGAGGSLGLETRQLNSTITYPASGRSANQLTTLEGIGMFSAALSVEGAYPNPADTAQTVGSRARSYLHTNCAQCHRPGGNTPVNLDLRYATAIAATNACNVTPASGDLGVSGAQIILPGDASRSVLYLRMSRRGANQMPPVGSHLLDTQGAALVQQWINGMGADCQ